MTSHTINHFCFDCKQWKPKSEFYKYSYGALRNKCKSCYKIFSRKLDAIRISKGYYKSYYKRVVKNKVLSKKRS